MTTLRLVTVPGDPDAEAAVAGRLSDRSDVELMFRCVDRIELLAAIRGGGLDAIVSVGAPSWFDKQAREEAVRAGVRLIGVVADAPAADRLAALGASLVPIDAPVDEIIQRCRAPDSAPPPPLPSSQPSTPRGKLLAVWGSKGAPGRTSLAIELAAELAAEEPDTILVDGDPYGGDVLQLLGVVEELPTIVWAARMAAKEELDPARLAMELRRAGRKGPVFLPGLPRPELWPEVSAFGWEQLLVVMRAAFRFTVCDVGFCLEPETSPYPGIGEGRNRIARATVASADYVVAVCNATPLGLKNFLWSFEQLSDLADPDGVVVVANRVTSGAEKEVADLLRRHVGKRPVAYVPVRQNDFARAAMDGRPVREIAPGSDVCAAMKAVVSAFGGRVRPSGLLSRLSGRSSGALAHDR